MARFRQIRSLLKFAAAYASMLNHDRCLERRSSIKDIRQAALIRTRLMAPLDRFGS